MKLKVLGFVWPRWKGKVSALLWVFFLNFFLRKEGGDSDLCRYLPYCALHGSLGRLDSAFVDNPEFS